MVVAYLGQVRTGGDPRLRSSKIFESRHDSAITTENMANTIHCRMPFGIVKRLRVATIQTSRPPHICVQRMTMANAVEAPQPPKKRDEEAWRAIQLPDDILVSIQGTKEQWAAKSWEERKQAAKRRDEERQARWEKMTPEAQASLLKRHQKGREARILKREEQNAALAAQKSIAASQRNLETANAEMQEEVQHQDDESLDLPPGYEHISKLDPRTRALLFNMSLPPNVQSIYLQPLRRAPTHFVPACDLQLRSFSVRNLEFFADFAMRAAYYMGMPAKGPVPLPQITERWTVPRGPFIHKKSQENFERKTFRRLIQIQDADPEVVQCWLGYLEKRSYHGIGMKANVWEHEQLDVVAKMDERAGVMDAAAESMWANFGVRKNALKNLDKLMSSEAFSSIPKPMEALKREPIEIKRRESPRVV